jgi:hypothetical protein
MIDYGKKFKKIINYGKKFKKMKESGIFRLFLFILVL